MSKIELWIDINCLRAARLISGRDETRLALCGVRLEADNDGINYVACDGRRLLAVRQPVKHDIKNPVAFTIPNYICDLVKAPTKKEPREKLLTYDDTGTPQSPTVMFPTTRNAVTLGGCVLGGEFPNWRKVIPLGKLQPVKGACFNSALVATFGDVGNILNPPSRFVGTNRGISLWSEDGENSNCMVVQCDAWRDGSLDVLALAMPMRDDQPTAPAIRDWMLSKEGDSKQ